jgi:tetratricopeptide (TPR) repeat protein
VTIVLGYDLITLREKVDEDAALGRLDELGELRSIDALGEKVGLLRILGRLDDALDVANEAVRQSRFTGDREQLIRARVRRAQVLQFLGKLDPALVDLTDCVDEALAHGWEDTEAFALQHRGKVHFDLHDYPAARSDFNDALKIRIRIKAPSEQVDSSMVAIAVVESFMSEESPADS